MNTNQNIPLNTLSKNIQDSAIYNETPKTETRREWQQERAAISFRETLFCDFPLAHSFYEQPFSEDQRFILSEPMSLQRVKLQVILDNSSICPWLPSSFISTCLLIHSIAPSPDLLELGTMMVEIIQPSIKSQYRKKLVISPASIEKKDLEKFWQKKEGENLLIERALYKFLF